jgi:hypothetical protein
LTDDVAASATTSTVENNNGFGTNDYVLFGNVGEEKTEIVLLTSTTGNTTLGHSTGPVFAHVARTRVSEIKYNQAEVYSATSETGSYTLLATVSLTPDQEVTTYDDTTGDTTTWYKIRYKNSTTTTYSDHSVPVQGTGYTDDSLRSMTDEILDEFGDPDEKTLTRTQIKRMLNLAQRKVTLQVIAQYPDYRKQYTTQALTASTATYTLPTRFIGFSRVDVNYSGSTATDAYKVELFESEAEGLPDTDYQETDPRIFFRANTFGLRPTPTTSGGYAFLWYWDYPEAMTDDNDEHGLPYGARDTLVAYVLFRLWVTRDIDKATIYKKEYKDGLEELLEFVGQGRQNYTPKRIDIIFAPELYEDY